MERTRYCQRCGHPQTLANIDSPNPCRQCGGTNFADHPKPHAWHYGVYSLTQADRDFLRCQKIDPED